MIATHRALNIPEIFRLVISEFGTKYGTSLVDPQDRAALAKLARCCQRFTDPALDVLWETVTSIIPLLSIIGLVELKDEIRRYTLLTRPDDAQWARLEVYAHRIQHVKGSIKGESTIEEFVFSCIAQHLNGRPLLPNLRSLKQFSAKQLFHLVSPRLRRLRILCSQPASNDENARGITCFIQGLGNSVPLLEEIELCMIKGIPYHFTSFLLCFHHLRSLKLNCLEDVVVGLDAVFTIPSLVRIELSFHSPWPSIRRHISRISKPAYPHVKALRHLAIFCNHDIVGDVLNCVAGAPLETLDIKCWISDDVSRYDLWHGWSDQLAQYCLSLRSFTFDDSAGPRQTEKVPIREMPIIERVLLRCSKLRSLHFMPKTTLDLSDEDFCAMAAAWPEIETVWISHDCGPLATPRATFAAVEALAVHCPKLRSLIIFASVDKATPGPPRTTASGLQYLFINSPFNGKPSRIAKRLGECFPELRSVLDDVEDSNTRVRRQQQDSKWARVDKIMKSGKTSYTGTGKLQICT